MIEGPSSAEALRRAAEAGPYFAITLDPDELLWRSFADLLEPDVLTENVAQVRRVLQERTRASIDDLEPRACASIHALGFVSRLVSPALGSAALTGHVPTLSVDRLRWQRVAGGPIPVAVVDADRADGQACDGIDDAADALHSHVIGTAVAPLISAFEATFSLSPQVLWGNVASAVAGAATMLRRSGRTARLDPVRLAEAVTSRGSLAGMGRWTSAGFARNNCCLFYKIPGGGKCGDCVLLSR